ncbi:MAG: hypothetical protein ACXW5U_11830 [Thermoanaerobaculia bacterium]
MKGRDGGVAAKEPRSYPDGRMKAGRMKDDGQLTTAPVFILHPSSFILSKR